MNQIEKGIINMLSQNNVLNTEEVNEDNYISVISELSSEIDSLLYISLLVEIEDKYGIELPDDALVNNIFLNINDFSVKLNRFLEDRKGGDENETNP